MEEGEGRNVIKQELGEGHSELKVRSGAGRHV